MLKLEYFEPVAADLQIIWSVLLDRIERPESYMAGEVSCEFLENGEDFAVRELNLGGFPLRERITIDERMGEVRYQLVDHPLFEGDVYNSLIPPAANDPKATPVVQFRMHWQPRNAEGEAIALESREMMEASLKEAVHYVRQMAEHLEQHPPESEARAAEV